MSAWRINIINETSQALLITGHHGNIKILSNELVIEPGQDSQNHIHTDAAQLFGKKHGWVYIRAGYDIKLLIFVALSTLGHIKTKISGAGLCQDHEDWRDHHDPFPERRFGGASVDSVKNVFNVPIREVDLQTARLRASAWMEDLTKVNAEAANWPLSNFHIPGTHDSGTFGPGSFVLSLVRTNWHCQELTFYEQLSCGVRCLDLRLGFGSDGKWYPCHGIASKTANVLANNSGINENRHQTVLGQILHFVQDHPNELVIVMLTLNTNSHNQDLWSTWMNGLADHLTPAVQNGDPIPTWNEMVKSGRSVITIAPKNNTTKPTDAKTLEQFQQYIWPNAPPHWMVNPYVDAIWQSKSPGIIRRSNETFMDNNAAALESRGRFWTAQCQLTPSFGSSNWFKEPSFSPRHLAELANPYTIHDLVPSSLWKQRSNIISVDFVNETLAMAIVGMNF